MFWLQCTEGLGRAASPSSRHSSLGKGEVEQLSGSHMAAVPVEPAPLKMRLVTVQSQPFSLSACAVHPMPGTADVCSKTHAGDMLSLGPT